MQELVAAKLPRLHQHLQSIGCDMTIIGATDWILCLYTTSLPAEVRHIDTKCRTTRMLPITYVLTVSDNCPQGSGSCDLTIARQFKHVRRVGQMRHMTC